MSAAHSWSRGTDLGRIVAASVLVNLAVIGVVLLALRWPNPQPIVVTTVEAAATGVAGGGQAAPELLLSPGEQALPAGAALCTPDAGTGGGESAIDINRASAAELEALPGIGPTLAQRIVEYRQSQGPFSTIEELMNVRGIGERTLDDLRGLVVVR